MTQLVTVQTDFTDLDQMAEGLMGRVHQTHVILPAGEQVDEGEWAQFEITLHDGGVGLAGIGRCVTVVDNGEDREAHQRFDVVLDTLQFDDHEQRVFEHILALHGVGGQQFEEVAAEDAESMPPQQVEHTDSFVDVSDTGSAISVPAEAFDDDAHMEGAIPDERTMVASPDELESLSDSVPSPGGEENDVEPQYQTIPSPRGGNGSSNGAGYHGSAAVAVQSAVFEDAFEEPVSGERIAPITQPRQTNSFLYTNGIPFPPKPPRPDLEPSLRVTPAPRPAGSAEH